MKWVKNILLVAIVWLFVVGAYRCLTLSAEGQALTARESTMLNYLLCILSVAASWLVSHYYALYSTRTNATEKIDTIAQQSTEKIMNQSAQLWELEQYLERSVDAAEEESSLAAAHNTLKNRLLASAQMVRLLRSSNTTFTSDWAGVTSSEVKTKMENQVKQQRQLFELYSAVNASEAAQTDHSADARATRTSEALERMEKAAKDLPAAALPSVPTGYSKAVTITQCPMSSSGVEARGHAVLHVSRPVDNVTGRIKLDPEFSERPHVSVVLQKVPTGVTSAQFTLRAGTASVRGFNIHLTANETELVPVGDYEVAYQVRPEQLAISSNSTE